MPLGDLGLTGVIGGLLQDKPKIPPFKPVDAQAEQGKAISGNLAALPGLENIGSIINDYLTKSTEKGQEALNPGYGALRKQEGDLASSLMSGKLPGFDDWVNRTSSEADAAFGFSSARKDTTAFNTMLQLEQTGASMADKWISESTKPQLFDFGGLLVDTKTEIGLATEERNAQFGVEYTRNQNDAAHSFGTIMGQSLIQSDQQMSQAIESL